jgi:serine acetyltransferase
MGSIVTKDIAPYSIVAGNPAKEIRKRFDDATIDKLLSSKWWDLPESDLKHFAQYFTSPKRFIEEIQK